MIIILRIRATRYEMRISWGFYTWFHSREILQSPFSWTWIRQRGCWVGEIQLTNRYLDRRLHTLTVSYEVYSGIPWWLCTGSLVGISSREAFDHHFLKINVWRLACRLACDGTNYASKRNLYGLAVLALRDASFTYQQSINQLHITYHSVDLTHIQRPKLTRSKAEKPTTKITQV